MSPLLRHPDRVPSLFARGLDADDRPASPHRRLARIGEFIHARIRSTQDPRTNGPPGGTRKMVLSAVAVALFSLPLAKGAIAALL